MPQLASFDKSLFERLRDIYRNFDENEAQRVKDIEKITNHDVKAVEYFIKEEFDKIGGLDALQGVYPFWFDISGYQQHKCAYLSL